MISASWVVLLLIGAVHALGNVVDPKFRTVCSLLYSRDPHGDATSHECYVSLFTYRNISFHDAIVYVSDDLCDKELVLDEYLRTALLARHIGLAAGRGGCSFSTKAQNAEALGFKLLLIINTDDQTFPVGPAEIDVSLTIPVLMAGSGMAKDLLLKDASTTGEAVEAVINGVAGAQFEDNTNALVDALVQLHVEFGNSCELNGVPRLHELNRILSHTVATDTHNPTTKQAQDPAGRAGQQTSQTLNASPVSALRMLATGAAIASALVLTVAFWFALDPAAPLPTRSADIAPRGKEATGQRSDEDPVQATALEARPSSPGTSDGFRVAAETALWLGYLAVGCVFVALRLGTLRIYAPGGSAEATGAVDVYNHRETDERVFEVSTTDFRTLVIEPVPQVERSR
jgi:hypothetical protein